MSSPESTLLVLSLVSEHITASFVAELRKQDAAPLSNEPSHVWRLKNRYYEAKVSIATAYDLSTALGQLQGVPALIVLSDYDAKPLIISRLLSSIAAYQMPDIAILALVKGHTNRDGDAVEAEWLDVAVEQGFELVDLEHAPETGDDGRDMTSYAYLASTLQTHLWPRVGATAPTGFDDDFSDFTEKAKKKGI
ncbi:uncharacterized protein L969DRAFT_96177 [Mixia osmundae IAM 14324]|uniref:Uncharacterized protein n=1 Tax=Mixia osmundae (strain CBS 9802 / IAM 14324 / JCM 22182 / KY 12970) TaxID=764103 RepID=G7E4S5_MIXOS|nr:uncharacterized protein L969DRAFT_96177 [Mixia osmundae IAM 14324]KEI37655.1 hypothetical protein L969DRAFT_96177 [Mixia osmundae IAM 14324]GAA97835.1 hypothetical protein E5Q_04514 [Mixia osmundae IAM 14324]